MGFGYFGLFSVIDILFTLDSSVESDLLLNEDNTFHESLWWTQCTQQWDGTLEHYQPHKLQKCPNT